jgi:hypothetical protein
MLPGQVDLSWSQPAYIGSPAIQGYDLYWGTTKASQPQVIHLQTPVTTHTDAPWQNGATSPQAVQGQPIYYHVVAINDAGLSGPDSNVACAIPQGTLVAFDWCPAPEGSPPEQEILNRTVVVGGQGLPVSDVNATLVTVTVSGKDGSHTDIDVTAAGTPLPTVSVYNGGAGTPPLPPLTLLHVPAPNASAPAISVRVVVKERHDAAGTCLVGVGGCLAFLPLDPTDTAWLTDGGRADGLVVEASVTGPDGEVAHARLILPYAGQVMAARP